MASILIKSPFLDDREIVDKRTRPFKPFNPSYWQSHIIQAFLRQGHTVTTCRDEIPKLEFDIVLLLIPREQKGADLTFFEDTDTEIVLRCHDSNLHLRRDIEVARELSPDYVLVRSFANTEMFRKNGFNAFYFPFAANPNLMKPYPDEPEYDIFFSGKLDEKNYKRRKNLIYSLDQEFNCDFHTYRANLSTKIRFPPMEGLAAHLFRRNWLTRQISGTELGKRLNVNSAPVSTEDYLRRFSKSRLSFQCTNPTNHMDFRVFESLACGSCLLHNKSEETEMLFEGGNHLVFYEGEEDLLNKAKHLLKNPEERKRIADTGRDRVLSQHTYERRVRQLLALIDGQFEGKADWLDSLGVRNSI